MTGSCSRTGEARLEILASTVSDESSDRRAAWPGTPALIALLLAIVMTWPSVLGLSSHTISLGDPLFETWQLAWIGHAIVHEPLQLYQARVPRGVFPSSA
jgi:hypothetical protein